MRPRKLLPRLLPPPVRPLMRRSRLLLRLATLP